MVVFLLGAAMVVRGEEEVVAPPWVAAGATTRLTDELERRRCTPTRQPPPLLLAVYHRRRAARRLPLLRARCVPSPRLLHRTCTRWQHQPAGVSESTVIVTGPSLMSATSIFAPKTPSWTRSLVYAARIRSTKFCDDQTERTLNWDRPISPPEARRHAVRRQGDERAA